MERFHWTNEYSMGIEKIDSQHKHLFEIVNNLIERSYSSPSMSIVSETLVEMIKYAREHFADEEELMLEYDYPEIEAQKKQHAYFIKTTDELITSAINNRQMAADEIAEFLKLWLTTHILKMDMKYKDFLKAKMPATV